MKEFTDLLNALGSLGSLLWPILTFGALLIFKSEIADLVKRITSTEILGTKLQFEGLKKEIAEVKTEAKKNLAAIEQEVDLKERLLGLMEQGRFFMDQKKWDQALATFTRALVELPTYEPALIGQGKVYKRKGDLKRAIDILSRIIESNPEAARAYYNRACYKCLAKDDLAEVLADLRKSITLAREHKVYARDDDDFSSIRERPEFQSLISN